MIRNFFTLAIRNILRDRYFALVNVVGLAIGLAVSLLIYGYVSWQLSFDTFHPDVDRLYRINQTLIWSPEGGIMNATALPLASTLQNDYPEVEEVIRINQPFAQLVSFDDPNNPRAFYEDNIIFADSNFFAFFGFELAQGDKSTALTGKNKIVLTPESAERYFGDESPIGKVLLWGDDKIPAEVTGVTKALPANAHIDFDCVMSMHTNPLIKQFEWSWIWTQVVTYVKLKPNTDVAAFQTKLLEVAKTYAAPTLSRFGIDFEDFTKDKGGWNFYAQPVLDIHLYSADIGNRLGVDGDIRYIYIFVTVGCFVLLLAIVNYVNLSTARGSKRAKEVGVKKTLGVSQGMLVWQFQFESLLLVAAATVLGLGFMELLRLVINKVVTVQLPMLWNTSMVWVVPAILVLVGVLSGLYPSLYLSRFNAATVLKGKIKAGVRSPGFRNALIGLQFVITLVFISATLLVDRQLSFFKEKDLGFDSENILVIDHAEKLGTHLESFADAVRGESKVVSAAIGMDIPGRGAFEDIFQREGSETKYPISLMKMDEHFLKTLKIQLVAGRDYDELTSANSGVIINETCSQVLGWTPEEAIGKRLIYLGDDIGPREIIGVVKDYHFQTLKMPIAPVAIYPTDASIWGDQRIVAIKFTGNDTRSVIQAAEQAWHAASPDAPFEYSMLTDEWLNKYKEEESLGGLFGLFTALSIVIAVIGLIGLVSYAAEQRQKEIGIRKVMGASSWNVVLLLNKGILTLMVLSTAVAIPLAWYAMHEWLAQFPYKISITLDVFLLAGFFLSAIVWVTTSLQSWRAASTNPVDSLRAE